MSAKYSARKLARLERAKATVLQIVSSRQVDEFIIGITSDPETRRRAYRRWLAVNRDNVEYFRAAKRSAESHFLYVAWWVPKARYYGIVPPKKHRVAASVPGGVKKAA